MQLVQTLWIFLLDFTIEMLPVLGSFALVGGVLLLVNEKFRQKALAKGLWIIKVHSERILQRVVGPVLIILSLVLFVIAWVLV